MVPSAQRERIAGFFTATAVLGAAVLLAAGAELLWHVKLVAIGCGLIVAALLVTIEAAQLSALWARFPLPVIPAPGDPTPSAPSLQVLEDLPRRVRVSDAHQSGFIAAAVLLSVLGSVAIALRPETLSGAGGTWSGRPPRRRCCAPGCGTRPPARRGCSPSPIWPPACCW